MSSNIYGYVLPMSTGRKDPMEELLPKLFDSCREGEKRKSLLVSNKLSFGQMVKALQGEPQVVGFRQWGKVTWRLVLDSEESVAT
jgi:hypothetical protein